MKVGEFELIEKIRRRTGNGQHQRLGIGDDCSSLEIPPGFELLTSTDLLLENIHFRLDWTDMYSLGLKSVAVNVSDIAAMGAQPLSLHLGLGLPQRMTDLQVEQFLDGFFAGMEEYNLFLAGGDTCRAPSELMIAVTIQGLCSAGCSILRSGAKIGEDIWVSGVLGDSALALTRLQAGTTLSAFLGERHFRPTARTQLGQELGARALATAMLDLSDGLSSDLCHLMRASGVGVQISLASIPLSKDFLAAEKKTAGLIDLALSGGEDYELLFTAKSCNRAHLEALSRELKISLSRIGSTTPGVALQFVDEKGSEYTPKFRGFDHFSAEAGDCCG